MPSTTESQDDLVLDAIETVFRRRGFEGATLSLLSEATGLQRASLYHRFPGGKEEMAIALLRRVNQRFSGHVLAPLGESGPLEQRLRTVARRLTEFYADGTLGCLLETLSLGDPPAERRRSLSASMDACAAAFTAAAREAGATPAEAGKRARRTLMLLQGALVLARVQDVQRPFLDAMRALPHAITAGA